MEADFKSMLTVNVLAALVTHICLNRRDSVTLQTALAALITVPLISTFLAHDSSSLSLSDLAWSYPIFCLTLTTSVCAYRLSPFHPLARYPGPLILKVSKLWGAWIAYSGKTHIYFKELHDEYGPTIRVGPNELSTIEKGFIPQILGHSGMPKGPLWDGRRFLKESDTRGYDNLVDLRDSVLHSQLRKPWNKAFSAEAVKSYEEFLIRKVVELNELLKEVCRIGEGGMGRVDIAKWVSSFSYDVMGEIAFSIDFHVMQDGDKEERFKTMEKALYNVSITQHVPWISKVVRDIPGLNTWMRKFTEYGVGQAVKRANTIVKHKDLFYYMGAASGNSEPDLPFIVTNVLLAIFAGSDTTASVIANALYLLISHPEEYRGLQREVDDAFNEHGIDLDVQSSAVDGGAIKPCADVLGGLPYLNAVINETLRLFPVVPTALQRAPAKGSKLKVLQSDNSTILLPEGNAIWVPPYVLHRNPKYFSPLPESFIPERWLPSATDEYITARDAFIPFSAGPQNCAGRTFAMLELRYVIATLVRNFEMEFDSGYDPLRWEKDMNDRYTFAKGILGVKLTHRLGGGRRDQEF